jgi:Septum formation
MRRAAWVIGPVLLLGLVGLVLFAARGPQSGNAFTLRVGDCFDVPASDAVGDITAVACTGAHDGEVFLAQDYPGAAGPLPYPGADAISTWVDEQCVRGAFEPYVGSAYAARPDLKVAYFFPPADAWARGLRQVTCYVASSNGTRATGPVASGEVPQPGSPAAS